MSGLGAMVVRYRRALPFGPAAGRGGLELLAAAACSAPGAVYIQRVTPDVPPLAPATAAMTISAIALAPFAAATGFPIPGAVTTVWLVILAVVATGGALVLFYTLIHRAGVVRANLPRYRAPALAICYGYTFLG